MHKKSRATSTHLRRSGKSLNRSTTHHNKSARRIRTVREVLGKPLSTRKPAAYPALIG